MHLLAFLSLDTKHRERIHFEMESCYHRYLYHFILNITFRLVHSSAFYMCMWQLLNSFKKVFQRILIFSLFLSFNSMSTFESYLRPNSSLLKMSWDTTLIARGKRVSIPFTRLLVRK